MPEQWIQDRRTFPRFTGDNLEVGVRQRGRLGRVRGTVLDFNRFGIAVLMAQPLPKDQEVFVTLRYGEDRVDNVIGVVHTCFSLDDGFRCGIQFRTQSRLQFDKDLVETALWRLEMGFTASTQSPDSATGAEPSASH